MNAMCKALLVASLVVATLGMVLVASGAPWTGLVCGLSAWQLWQQADDEMEEEAATDVE